MKTHKILHVIDSMDPETGGVCKAVRMIISGLNSFHVVNEVVSQDVTDAMATESFTTHALGPKKTPWSYSKKLVPWLKLNLENFDVVILHGLWLYNGYALNKVIRHLTQRKSLSQKKLPRYFVMPHGMLDPYFQQASNRKLKALRNLIYWQLIERKVVNDAAGILFTCEEERRLARQSFRPYQPRAEFIVGLGVEDPPAFKSEMRDAFLKICPGVGTSPYLLYLGRIHEKKGVDLLINAYKQMTGKKDCPKLVIAGPNLDSAFGKKIQSWVLADAILNKNVHFPGMLSGNEKWGAIYGCEAFVLPSHQENFGIAVVEALACGKPVLISNQVNIWREISDADSGIIRDDTQTGTNELLNTWHELPVNRRELLQINARQGYETTFTIKAAAERLHVALDL